jgi:hypothetical protein
MTSDTSDRWRLLRRFIVVASATCVFIATARAVPRHEGRLSPIAILLMTAEGVCLIAVTYAAALTAGTMRDTLPTWLRAPLAWVVAGLTVAATALVARWTGTAAAVGAALVALLGNSLAWWFAESDINRRPMPGLANSTRMALMAGLVTIRLMAFVSAVAVTLTAWFVCFG